MPGYAALLGFRNPWRVLLPRMRSEKLDAFDSGKMKDLLSSCEDEGSDDFEDAVGASVV